MNVGIVRLASNLRERDMSNTMDPVTTTLGLDKADMSGHMIAIEEQHGCDGTFLISSIMHHALKKEQAVCLVLYHSTFNHYHNVGMRLGYNLMSLRDKGQITVVEPMKDIALDVENMCEDKLDNLDSILLKSNAESNVNAVHKLFSDLKDKYYEAKQYNRSVLLIVDDLSHLCDLGFTLTDVMYYVRFLKSLIELDSAAQLCLLTHVFPMYSQDCTANALANSLKHTAHLFVSLEPLQTGYSSDASGKLIINWRPVLIRREFHWPEKATYLYKLLNGQVKIYAPGMVGTVL